MARIVNLNESSVVKLLEDLLELAKEDQLESIMVVGDTPDKDYYVAYSNVDIHDKYRFIGYLNSHMSVETFMNYDFEQF